MINLVIALQAEAKPIIQHYRLNGHQAAAGFRVYQRDDIQLIISGKGKLAAAAATAYMASNEDHAWLNLGLAGSTSLPLGDGALVDKIGDASSGLCWYPPQIVTPPTLRSTLTTVDTPQANGGEPNMLYDMEASGFYATASRFSSSELVQCFKIVSDDCNNPCQTVDASLGQQLISNQLTAIDNIVDQLRDLLATQRAMTRPPEHMDTFLQQWHFTTSQQHQLKRLLQRWQVLAPNRSPLNHELLQQRHSKQVLPLLLQQLDEFEIQY